MHIKRDIIPALVLLVVLSTLGFCTTKQTSYDKEKALAKKIGFDPAIVISFSSHKEYQVSQLIGFDEEGNDVKVKGLSVTVPKDKGYDLQESTKADLKKKGYLVFVDPALLPDQKDKLEIIKSKDQLDIVRIMGTNGLNYDIDNKAVIARLKAWDKRYGIEIYGAGGEWVTLEFKKLPAKPDALAKEVYKFCPDVVDQGVGSVKQLAKEISSKAPMFLWWD